MKRTSINTKKTKIGTTVNNGDSFPELLNTPISDGCYSATFSGSTNFQYHSTSTFNNECQIYDHDEADKINYVICLDWMEFICTWENPVELAFINNIDLHIIIQKISVHKNPNFKNLHRVYHNGVEACDIYSSPNNSTHATNEVSVKVANVRLYEGNYYDLMCEILKAFGLTFLQYARVDIALDGTHILQMSELLNKWFKSHTVQTNNNAIKILPTAFNKKELKCVGWSIGNAKSGISARIYNKSTEIAESKKDYVSDFWSKNGMVVDGVGRLEVQLNYKRLKKYNLTLDDLKQFMDAEFLGAIFETEVRPWLRLYRVKRKDFLNHKKEIAIQKGKEIRFIDWDRLPAKMEHIRIENHIPNSARINARNTISFNLNEILLHPDTSTTAQVEIIQKYATDYELNNYVISKINCLFGNPMKDQYLQILNPLITPAKDQ
jgi:hypothetical protein